MAPSADGKTDRMKLIEIERGEPMEKLLPRLIMEKGSVRGAAEELEVWPSVISRWLTRLGLSVEYGPPKVVARG